MMFDEVQKVEKEIYECDCCGACCRTFPVFASEGDAVRAPEIKSQTQKLPEYLATAEWQYQLYPLPFNESCCFLDGENKCSIYEKRPKACNLFEAGSSQCQEARQRHGIDGLKPL